MKYGMPTLVVFNNINEITLQEEVSDITWFTKQ